MSATVFPVPMNHPHVDGTCFVSVAEAKAMIAFNDDGMVHTLEISPGICGCNIPLRRIHEAIESMGGAYLAKCGTTAYDLDHRIAVLMPEHGHWTFVETGWARSAEMNNIESSIYQASCFNTNSNADCCEHANISISNTLLERVSSLQALVIKHDLDTIAAYSNDVLWGSEDFETEYGLEGTKLVVAKTCFWFSNTIKHCDGELQTESMSTHQLKQLLAETRESISSNDSRMIKRVN